jgi:peptidoglycan/LPS O-acetylase OafA/YrhL
VTSELRHDRSADGLRGLAAFNVVLSHFVAAFFPVVLHFHYLEHFKNTSAASAFERVLQYPFLALAYNGHFPVLVFFALSGYVLTLPHWQGQRQKIIDRLLARYLRLFIPIIASIVLSLFLYKFGLYFNRSAAAVAIDSQWLRLYFDPQMLDPKIGSPLSFAAATLAGSAALNPPLWSLRIEFIGSMLLLAFYAFAKPAKFDTVWLAVCTALLCFVFRSDAVYYIPIFVGAWLGRRRIADQKWVVLLSLAGLFFGALTYDHWLFNWLPDMYLFDRKNFYNALGACLLVSGVINGFGARFLQTRPVQFLARVSFSLYLTHFLVLCSLSCALYLLLPASPWAMALNFLAYLVVCLLLAGVFTRLVDQPAMDWSRRFAKMSLKLLGSKPALRSTRS